MFGDFKQLIYLYTGVNLMSWGLGDVSVFACLINPFIPHSESREGAANLGDSVGPSPPSVQPPLLHRLWRHPHSLILPPPFPNLLSPLSCVSTIICPFLPSILYVCIMQYSSQASSFSLTVCDTGVEEEWSPVQPLLLLLLLLLIFCCN